MARKSFKKYKEENNKTLQNVVIELEEKTNQALNQVKDNPNNENISNAIKVINEDKILTPIQKKELLKQFEDRYITQFKNCPNDYINLKIEAKFLSRMTTNSFVFMAERLKKIRDEKLYLEDGYSSFNDFVREEISINRTTAFKYIKIIDIFGVDAHQQNINPSNLVHFLPLFKIIDSEQEQKKIKEQALNAAINNSYRKAKEIADKLKGDYKNQNKPKSLSLANLEKKIEKLSYEELQIITDFCKNKLKNFH